MRLKYLVHLLLYLIYEVSSERVTANLNDSEVSSEKVRANLDHSDVSSEKVRANLDNSEVSSEEVRAKLDNSKVSSEEVRANLNNSKVSSEKARADLEPSKAAPGKDSTNTTRGRITPNTPYKLHVVRVDANDKFYTGIAITDRLIMTSPEVENDKQFTKLVPYNRERLNVTRFIVTRNIFALIEAEGATDANYMDLHYRDDVRNVPCMAVGATHDPDAIQLDDNYDVKEGQVIDFDAVICDDKLAGLFYADEETQSFTFYPVAEMERQAELLTRVAEMVVVTRGAFGYDNINELSMQEALRITMHDSAFAASYSPFLLLIYLYVLIM